MIDETPEILDDEKEEKVIRKIRNLADIQRLKLEKLMNNPTKPVVIPERIQQNKVPSVPEFVRNVMGSSAGAGSGEFHVYRHLRRKEFARQKYITEQAKREQLDREFEEKIQKQQEEAMEKTAKKREKRLKKKEKLKSKKKIKSIPKDIQQISLEDDMDDMDSN